MLSLVICGVLLHSSQLGKTRETEKRFYTFSLLSLTAQNPCDEANHKYLRDSQGVRGSGSSGSSHVCDAIITQGWYRVLSPLGGDMPTTCVTRGSCGTKYPVWLEGNLLQT